MIVALAGPTATGKTQIACEIAEAIGAEIVCADSMTIYRGMDVGTAKPTPAERERVPHHMLDVAGPGERYTAARFQAQAREAIAAIGSRGKVAMVVGGSGLYMRAALDPLEFPPDDETVRARIASLDGATLRARLREADPDAASFIDPANLRRVVRALEVIELTGRPFSSFRRAWESRAEIAIAGLDLPQPVLAARIETRLRAQLDAGLLEEVRRLVSDGFESAPTASRAVPYPDALALLRGEVDEAGFLQRATKANVRLSRRQRAWFKADPRVRWFDPADARRAASEVRAYYEEHLGGRDACAS